MRAYAKAIGNIWKSSELTPQQKRDAIDALYVENIDVARAMLKTLYPQPERRSHDEVGRDPHSPREQALPPLHGLLRQPMAGMPLR
jgi:hypothetical protein